MNPRNNVQQERLDEYELSAIYDDAGTPPREEWRKHRSEVRRMKTRQQRREQLERLDLWLRTFRTDHPFGYMVFSLGWGLVFGAGILAALNFLEWLSPAR
jgi:hypothetical protein